jgi:hypothetical protein
MKIGKVKRRKKPARHAPRIRIFSMSRPIESSEEMDKPHSSEYK